MLPLVAAAIAVLVSAALPAERAQAKSDYLTAFIARYPNAKGSKLDNCNTCHVSGSTTLNPYGSAYKQSGHNFATIEGQDSDGDGVSNLTEINALTFPGDKNDKPAASTPTRTPIPPSPTATKPGASATATVIAPTATKIPPTATKPGASATATIVAPTATKIPPTATAAATTIAPTPGVETGSTTFNPVADAYVDSSNASRNYGTSAQIRVDSSPIVRSYLRFNVTGLTGAVTKATLRVYANGLLNSGITANRVANNSWGETAITYGNAPAVGSAIATSNAVSANAWVSIDVTSYVTGNGTFSFALTSTNANALSLASRESSNKPKLVIKTAIAATATATRVAPTATRTATAVAPTATPSGTGSHVGRFATYEGSKTCALCHAGKASEVHASAHYQWKGDTPDVPNLGVAGKLGSINDFCTYPDINWIGQLTNLDGALVDGGCAQCHVGLGDKPTAEATQAQLDNIDCLVCHSDSYKRKVASVNGKLQFVPAPEKMSVPLINAITDIKRPSKATCLACHANAGGGNNNKRGDLEQAHANPPSASFDVHMASTALGGAGLDCTDCHQTQNHRIAGRGSDLRETDLNVAVRCTNCHNVKPHGNNDLDKHTARVDCTVCHIPTYAKIRSTDMFRDFRAVEIDPVKRLYEPKMTRQSNVTPQYAFFNGTSYFAEFGKPVTKNAAGSVVLSSPLGKITDAGAKIFAFKKHQALQALDPVQQMLIPFKMGVLFQSGNVDQAIQQGAAAVGWTLSQGYQFIPTERYMGIFHGVAPKAEALTCNACHSGGTRLDFDGLGYAPNAQRAGKPLCASCHSDKSGEWSSSTLFTKVHAKHVTDKKINCSECHGFSKAQ
ncbi:MAG: DNRLRE domain-containing protein [Chloroflexi bacterium]|nr:DNRLRE domain-containing protein [Chloroflexota bacterium]